MRGRIFRAVRTNIRVFGCVVAVSEFLWASGSVCVYCIRICTWVAGIFQISSFVCSVKISVIVSLYLCVKISVGCVRLCLCVRLPVGYQRVSVCIRIYFYMSGNLWVSSFICCQKVPVGVRMCPWVSGCVCLCQDRFVAARNGPAGLWKKWVSLKIIFRNVESCSKRHGQSPFFPTLFFLPG